ncbi:DEAD/DEAH box helicase [Limnoraphis robusta Tam1]|uniref:DEAD/DEAH box helicase n=1 Tax=Limnoraphis robusta TaxID=1118279 RepID=UPI002B1EC0D0|nr:DEAD/DEAH box helicase [Limnoraphis robusta]MEA5540183.1 DEAD/DEAH box helicase [Limnoraphis robusta Tam1]
MSYSTQNPQQLELDKLFPFQLDPFQLEAIDALNAGKSVVVCAPTGSGKTLIGEYAIYRALSRGKRVFYTTPLKALSNQKLRDFRERFGVENVGLLTGDLSMNREAAIVVMTTEIFRNMLYGTPIGEVGTSLEGVEAVVLDECHYMNDRTRGTVWEESIIYCPPEIQLLALSATIANSDQLTDWLCKVHGPTELIYSDFRPVPLQFHFCNTQGLFPLLNENGTDINRHLKPKKRHNNRYDNRRSRFHTQQQGQSLVNALKQLQKQGTLPTIYFISSRKGCDRAVLDPKIERLSFVNSSEAERLGSAINSFLTTNPKLRNFKSLDALYRGIATYHLELPPPFRMFVAELFRQGLVKVLFVPETLYVLYELQEEEMLPAIYFIFSRRGCDLAVEECFYAVHELGFISLVNEEEAALLREKIDIFAHNNDVSATRSIEPLYLGIAAHHAGILPTWKMLVEELFTLGLIKVVYATETLAAGINMPARTTVISSLSKRTDEGIRLLKPSEFLQMSGRAGRRGMDLLGHVVTVQTPFEGAEEAYHLTTKEPDPLVSQFTPSYGMVLNLLQTHSLEQAKALIERSFGQYLSTASLQPQEIEMQQLQAELADIEANLGLEAGKSIDELETVITHYEKLQARLREEKRLLKLLQDQAEETRTAGMSQALVSAVLGTIVSLRGKHVSNARSPEDTPLAAVLVAQTPSPGQAPYFLCLGQDNRWYVVGASDVVALHGDIPRLTAVDYMDIPDIPYKLGQKRKGDTLSDAIAQQIPDVSLPEIPPEVQLQMQQVSDIENQLETHPLYEWGKPQKLLKRRERWTDLNYEIRLLQAEIEANQGHYWQKFLDLILILQQFEALDELQPTRLGQATAALRGDNELWLGIALMSGEFDDLEPAELAAACAALVTEISRSDTWTDYQLSQPVQAALERLWGLRKNLIKIQSHYQVEFLVLPERWEHQNLSSIIEQWGQGIDWLQLVEHTSLDEGDLVRMIRRTLDFLSQIPHVPHLNPILKQKASEAKKMLDRYPINEDVE